MPDKDVRTPVTASSLPSLRMERWGWRRAAKARKESGSDSGESEGIVDLSCDEPNMNNARN
jgi:hypothetical protein